MRWDLLVVDAAEELFAQGAGHELLAGVQAARAVAALRGDAAREPSRDWVRRADGRPVLVVRLPDGRALLASPPRGRGPPR